MKGFDMNDRTDMRTRIRRRSTERDCGYTSPCWISDRAAYGKGYTKMAYNGTIVGTHRVAYEVFVAPIPEGMQIDHLCRQRACCNPAHLEPVTCRDNLLRGDTVIAREVATTHCPRGHAYDEANTYVRPDGQSKRGCRACRNTQRQRAKAC